MVARLFYSNNMKTIIFAALLSAAGIMSANAQEAVDISANYGYTFMPSCLTTNGKAAFVGINEDEPDNMTASIRDADMKVVKQFKINKTVALMRSYSESAIVKPSGAEIKYIQYQWKIYDNEGEPVTATDMNSLIERMSEIYAGQQFYGFTDLEGNVSCHSLDSLDSGDLGDFLYPNWFGTAYPYEYYSIIDGTVYQIRVAYNPTFSQADLDNAEWKKGDSFYEENICHYPILPIDYYNCDTNIFYTHYIYASQALFNDDDKWEYILPQYGPVKKNIGDPIVYGSDEKGVILSRTVYEEPENLGFGIYDEDGNVIASLKVPNGQDPSVFISNGNIYLEVDGGNAGYIIYKYDRATSSVKEISRSKSNAPIISMNGRRITVGADGNNIDEAVLYDMGGRSIASSRRTNGDNITINAANVAQGVYNVALKNKGRIAGAQKIIIK